MTQDLISMLTQIISIKSVTYAAKKIKCSRPTIYRTLNGETSPTYENGKAIEALYNEVVAEQQKAV